MQGTTDEVIVALIAGTVLMLLLATFMASFFLIYQRKRYEHQQEVVRIHEAYQREILQAQIETQNQTLQHVSGELHDHIGQLLSVAMLQINVLDEDLTETPHQPAVKQTASIIEQVLTDLRVLSKTLNTDAVSQLGLPDSIALELDRIHRTGRYQTQLTLIGEPRSISSEVVTVLFRMVQEAISNALKHARARHIYVTLEYPPSRLILRIADDGQGIAPTGLTGPRSLPNGQGMDNLHRRATLLGGTCTVNSQPNEGCIIAIDVPLV